jgi:hypothetical protein
MIASSSCGVPLLAEGAAGTQSFEPAGAVLALPTLGAVLACSGELVVAVNPGSPFGGPIRCNRALSAVMVAEEREVSFDPLVIEVPFQCVEAVVVGKSEVLG